MPYVDSLGDSYRYDPNYHRFCDFLGIDKFKRDNLEVAKKVSLIYEWADKNGGGSIADIMGRVHGLKRDIGVNTEGNLLINTLYQWIRLDADRKRSIQDRIDTLEKQKNKEEMMKDMRKEGKEWKKDHRQLNRRLNKEKELSEVKTDKIIRDYKKEFKPERSMRIQEISYQPTVKSVTT